jgi:hypothetical protein
MLYSCCRVLSAPSACPGTWRRRPSPPTSTLLVKRFSPYTINIFFILVRLFFVSFFTRSHFSSLHLNFTPIFFLSSYSFLLFPFHRLALRPVPFLFFPFMFLFFPFLSVIFFVLCILPSFFRLDKFFVKFSGRIPRSVQSLQVCEGTVNKVCFSLNRTPRVAPTSSTSTPRSCLLFQRALHRCECNSSCAVLLCAFLPLCSST